MPYTCGDVWLELQVDAPGTYQLSAVDCFEEVQLAVFSQDATLQLGSVSGLGNACPVLEHSFAQGGSYPLLLCKTNSAGCSVNGTAGDFFFNIAAQ